MMNDPDALDIADMQRLCAGHDAALNDLMERHEQHLFHYLLRYLPSEAEAGDAAQETFVRVYQHREKFDSTRKFSTWLYTIATNLARNRLKWLSRHPQVSLHQSMGDDDRNLGDFLPDPRESPDTRALGEERAEAVRAAVNRLPPQLREPLLLAEYEDLSAEEIGEILNCSRKAVETRIYRARQLLRDRLESVLAQT